MYVVPTEMTLLERASICKHLDRYEGRRTAHKGSQGKHKQTMQAGPSMVHFHTHPRLWLLRAEGTLGSDVLTDEHWGNSKDSTRSV